MTDDMDELQEALKTGEITRLQYERAIATAQKLRNGLLSDMGKFQNYVSEMLHMIKSC